MKYEYKLNTACIKYILPLLIHHRHFVKDFIEFLVIQK